MEVVWVVFGEALGRFWLWGSSGDALGRLWESFGEALWRLWGGFGKLWGGFGKLLEGFGKLWGGFGVAYLTWFLISTQNQHEFNPAGLVGRYAWAA